MAFSGGDEDRLHRTNSLPLPFPQNSLFVTTSNHGEGFPRVLPPVSPGQSPVFSPQYSQSSSSSPSPSPIPSPATRLLQGFEAFSVSRAVSMPVTLDEGADDGGLPRLPPFRAILNLSGAGLSPSPPRIEQGNPEEGTVGRCLSSQEFLQRHENGDEGDSDMTGVNDGIIPHLSLNALPEPMNPQEQQLRQLQLQQLQYHQQQQQQQQLRQQQRSPQHHPQATQLLQQQQQQTQQQKFLPFGTTNTHNQPQPHSLHQPFQHSLQPNNRFATLPQQALLPTLPSLHAPQQQQLHGGMGTDLSRHLSSSPHSSPKDGHLDKKLTSGRLCRHPGCKKTAQTGGFCRPHGGGSRCKHPGCTKCAQKGGYCTRHGGGVRCGVPGCPKGAQVGGFCVAHGGGRRCQKPGCKKSAQKGNFCVSHGGAWRCRVPGCEKLDAGRGLCIRHGGGRRCQEKDCHKLDKGGGFCVAHGKNPSAKDEQGSLLPLQPLPDGI